MNADIREKCVELAEQGFLAIAGPILASRARRRPRRPRSEADWQHGLRLYQAYNRDEGVRDIKDNIDTVAKMPECTGKIAQRTWLPLLGALMDFALTASCATALDAGGRLPRW